MYPSLLCQKEQKKKQRRVSPSPLCRKEWECWALPVHVKRSCHLPNLNRKKGGEGLPSPLVSKKPGEGLCPSPCHIEKKVGGSMCSEREGQVGFLASQKSGEGCTLPACWTVASAPKQNKKYAGTPLCPLSSSTPHCCHSLSLSTRRCCRCPHLHVTVVTVVVLRVCVVGDSVCRWGM